MSTRAPDAIAAEPRDALVLGAGVIGLSAAARLLEAGYRVRVCARSLPPAVTSCIAAAFWYPYNVFPAKRVREWSLTSYAVFSELADRPETGVRRVPTLELLPRALPRPGWSAMIPDFRSAPPAQLPEGYPAGFAFTSFVIETPRYLPWLLRRVRTLGGVIETRTLSSLADAPPADVIVNCTGLASRELVGDAALTPVRGQLVRVENPGVERVIIDEHSGADAITYIVPRRHDVVLGGTAERGRDDLEPDPAVTERIVARCRALEPRLADARVLETYVGLRPCRDVVRLEQEQEQKAGDVRAPVIHNYGHGGAGVTLSWGCARETLALVQRALGARRSSPHESPHEVARHPERRTVCR